MKYLIRITTITNPTVYYYRGRQQTWSFDHNDTKLLPFKSKRSARTDCNWLSKSIRKFQAGVNRGKFKQIDIIQQTMFDDTVLDNDIKDIEIEEFELVSKGIIK